jgi:hypothetical protein
MFFRKAVLGAARSCAIQPSKRADSAGKICEHPKVLKQRCGLVHLPVPDPFQSFIIESAIIVHL